MVFNLSPVSLINVLIIAMGIGVCLLCILQMGSSSHIRKEVRHYFVYFFSTILLYISAHLVRELMNGIPGDAIRVWLNIVTITELIAAGIMTQMMSFLVVTIARANRFLKQKIICLFVFLLVHIILVIVLSLTGLIYVFNENNEYSRGTLYLLSNLIPVLLIVFNAAMLVIYRKNILNKDIMISLWNYIVAPVVAVAIQSFLFGVQFIIIVTIAAAVYMFTTIIRDQNRRYEKQQQESARIETELSMASSIQEDMLPNIFPAFPNRSDFDVFASMDPAKEVGGDFYDFFLIDDDHLCLVIADVSGKGVPAALFMMASKIIIANNAKLYKTPAKIITESNKMICSNNGDGMFVTVWLGVLELSTGKLTATNAGHELPAICLPNGKFEFIKTKHDFIVGGMDGLTFHETEIQLQPGSKIFIYTDGVAEATDKNNKRFGMDRLNDALNINPKESPEQICKQVRKSVDEFVQNAEQFDDITMLCFEYKLNK